MTKKVSLEPGFEVNLPETAISRMKTKPTSLPPSLQEEVFQKQLEDIFLKQPVGGGFRIKREIRRQENLSSAFRKINEALKTGVRTRQQGGEVGGRSLQGVLIRDVDLAVRAIRNEFDAFVANNQETLFFEPASIESTLRPTGSTGGGLVALANAFIITSKYIQAENINYPILRLSENREEFIPLEAYRSGYMLDYLEGIQNIENLNYTEHGTLSIQEEIDAMQARNLSREGDRQFILQQSQIKKTSLRQTAIDMRMNCLYELDFQLKNLVQKKNPQSFNISQKDTSIIEACLANFYSTATPGEKNFIASSICLRKVLSTGGSTRAAGWHLWADNKNKEQEFLYPPLSNSASVLESLLKPAKSKNLAVYDPHNKPKGWIFLEFDLLGSGDDGRVFVAHLPNAVSGDAVNFSGSGDLWLVLIVDPHAHTGATPGSYTEKYRRNIKDKFSGWSDFGLRNPFQAKPKG